MRAAVSALFVGVCLGGVTARSVGVGQQIGVDPNAVRREVKAAARQAEIDRLKRIERDAERLVQLATEVKAAAGNPAATEKNLRELEQMEALAADLKRRELAGK